LLLAGAFPCPFLSELHDTFARYVLEPHLAEFLRKRLQRERYGAAGRLVNLLHVLDVKVNQMAKRRWVNTGALGWRFDQIDF
jgi:hypothetical protein